MVGSYNAEKLNADTLKGYVQKRLNDSLIAIGIKPVFEVPPGIVEATAWMDEDVLGNTLTDFFHKRPVEYSKNNQSIQAEDLF
jgi:ribonucleoside-diphosphate reductase beta chain